MTDARYPDRWLSDRRILRLSDAEHRSFVVALAWSVSNRTDGRIERGDLDLIPTFRTAAVPALVASGLWVANSVDSWTMTDYEHTQSTRNQLEGLDHRRFLDRERQAKKRAWDRDQFGPDGDPSRDSPRDVTRDECRDTKARQGQARQEQCDCPQPYRQHPRTYPASADCSHWQAVHPHTRGAGIVNRLPITVTEDGSLLLWPDTLEALACGPGLTLEELALLEGVLAEARPLARAWFACQQPAKVVDLDQYRDRRADHRHRPGTEREVR